METKLTLHGEILSADAIRCRYAIFLKSSVRFEVVIKISGENV
jgi:hypothetical protein